MGFIIWTEAMEVTLLKLIISSGLHLVSKGTKESKKIWNQVNKDLFMNDEFLDYKDEHFVLINIDHFDVLEVDQINPTYAQLLHQQFGLYYHGLTSNHCT